MQIQEHGRFDVLEKALKEYNGKFDINALSKTTYFSRGVIRGNPSLYHAIQASNLEIIQLLLENGATIDDKDMLLACSKGRIDIVSLLMKYGGKLTAANSMDNVLSKATSEDNHELVEFLCQYPEVRELINKSKNESLLYYAVVR